MEDQTKLVADVRDLLNQIALKLKNVQGYDPKFSDDGYPQYNAYRDTEDEDENGEPYIKLGDQELFLGCLKNVIGRAIRDSDGTYLEENELKYYNSTCF